MQTFLRVLMKLDQNELEYFRFLAWFLVQVGIEGLKILSRVEDLQAGIFCHCIAQLMGVAL